MLLVSEHLRKTARLNMNQKRASGADSWAVYSNFYHIYKTNEFFFVPCNYLVGVIFTNFTLAYIFNTCMWY